MTQENPIQTTTQKLRKAVEDRDFLSFSREHAKIVSYCRRALFHGDRETLDRWYPEISSLLIWFYRSGKAEWPEAERSMGGLEILLSFMGNFLETRTLQETLAEVGRSGVDREILRIMSQNPEGMKSGDLAGQLGKAQNSVTNRLPAMEKLGLIVRSRVGKNSVIYLTPKGRGIAKDLQDIETPKVCDVFAADKNAEPQPFNGVLGEELAPGERMSFWFSSSAVDSRDKTAKASSTRSEKGTYH